MKVELISYTAQPKETLDKAVSLPYGKEPNKGRLEKVLNMGHTSVAEHVSFTFWIEEVSIPCARQMFRHRIASPTEKSGRYTDLEDFLYTIPQSYIEAGKVDKYIEHMESCRSFYKKSKEWGIPKEDCRYGLPQAMNTTYVWTMNARSLMNFMAERLHKSAQWEIRELAEEMKKCVVEVMPELENYLKSKGE